MRILIRQPQTVADVCLASAEVRKALQVLEGVQVKTDGGGTIESDGCVTGVVVIKLDSEVTKALEALAQAGIKASMG